MSTSFKNTTLLVVLLFHAIFSISHQDNSEDLKEGLVRGINDYRKSMNFTSLTHAPNAKCLADKLADWFEGVPCTDDSNKGPPTDYIQDAMCLCQLGTSENQPAGFLMSVCGNLKLDHEKALLKITDSKTSHRLTDTEYSGIGIGVSGNWAVVVLPPKGPFRGYGL